MQGMKPKPSEIKKAEGNPGGRPLCHNNTRPPDPKSLDLPELLDEVARREWWAIAPELQAMGLLTLVDKSALAMYCFH